MRLPTVADDEVFSHSNETDSETVLQMANNAKAFSAMAENLYRNKVGSIVRELSSNAIDSHIENGNPETTFTIHLPNHFEPFFAIRDFGIGMSPDIMKNVFNILFCSTKEQSNDLLGAYGLGSKTPYTISNAYTVTSYYGGHRYHYAMAKNDKGIPTCTLLQKKESDDPTGVEVSVPIKSELFVSFREETASQLRFFPVKPIITNGEVHFNDSLDTRSGALLVDSPIVRVRTGHVSTYGDDAGIFAVLGIVGYPLELQQLGNKLSSDLRTFAESIQGRSALFFEIGDIEVISGREGISYTSDTINAIITRLKLARAEILNTITAKVKSSATPWEQAVFANEYESLTPLFIKTGFAIAGAQDYENFYAFDIHNAQKVFALSKVTNDPYRDWRLCSYHFSSRGTFGRDIRDGRFIRAKSNCAFLVRDITKKVRGRIREYYDGHPGTTLYVIERDESNFTEADIQDFSDALGGVPIQRLSTLPEPKNTPFGREYVSRVGYKQAKGHLIKSFGLKRICQGRISDNDGVKIFDDLEDIAPGIYVPADHGIVANRKGYTCCGDYWDVGEALDIIHSLYKAQGHTFPNVYVLNAKNSVLAAEEDHLFTADEFINTFLAKVPTYSNTVLNMKIRDRLEYDIRSSLGRNILDKFTDDAIFNRLDKKVAGVYPIRLYRTLQKRHAEPTPFEILVRKYFKELVSDDDVEKRTAPMKLKIEHAFDKLRLLQKVNGYQADEIMDHLIDYINTMGK